MANVQCVYEGKSYQPGTVVTQAGVKMQAGEDGRWYADSDSSSQAPQAPVSSVGAVTCQYAGQSYSEGSLICQAGHRMRCMGNGGWGWTGEKC